MMENDSLIIDNEFKQLIGALGEDELKQLEANVLAEGIRDPLVVWARRNTLLDGHNRYAIAQEHGLDYQTVEIELPTRDAAKLWIIKNQLGKRNLTPQQMSYLRGKRYEMEKAQGARTDLTCDHFDHKLHNSMKTSERIADEMGVSAPTVRRDADFARAVDTIEGIAGAQAKNDLLSGNVRMSKKDIKSVARLASEAPELAVEVVSGKKTIEQAEKSNAPHVSHNAGDNEWYTPLKYIDAARKVMGEIDLDPASSDEANKTVCAKSYYTQENDGLVQHWFGRVWMNPPYAQPLVSLFTKKLIEHFVNGDVTEAIVLVNNATETKWFQRLAKTASAVAFPRGRVKFWGPEEKEAHPLQGQAILYLGNSPDLFISVFAGCGFGGEI